MTINEIKSLNRNFLTPAEVAGVLGCDPQMIRIAARNVPNNLGFPVCIIGTRTKIPRIAFLKFLGYE